MKIVQSYWSKPSLKKENFNISDRNKGGWVDKKYNYMSWALSCLQFRKHYDKVELVTDSIGYDLLIDKLGLPYTSVKVCLDDLNEYNSDLWALGKIYAYGVQDEHFIHADGDIYIFDRFNTEIETSDLIAQNKECNFSYYDEVFKAVSENFIYVPGCLKESKELNNGILAVNAGILGGNNIDFFKSYTSEAFDFVNQNLSKLNHVNIGMFNTVFEQFLFHALAEKEKIDISYYLSNVNHAFDGLAELTAVPSKKYIHTVGVYKRMKYIGDLVAHRLITDYPEYYFRIMNLIRSNQI